MPLPILGLFLLAGGAAIVLSSGGRRKATPAEAQVLALVAKGYTVDQLEALGIGRVVGYEPGAGPGGWVGAGGAPPVPPVCYWDEVTGDCGPNPCPPGFPDCDPVPNCPPDQAWYSEFNACYPTGQQPGANAQPPKCGNRPPELFCEDYENAICINGVWFCVKQLPPNPKSGEPCGREGYKGTIGEYTGGYFCEGTPGSLNGRWRRPKKGDPCPPPGQGIPTGLHCAYGELHETRAGSPCEQVGQWVVTQGAPLFCTSAGRLAGISEGNECAEWAPGGTGQWRSPDGELVCYQGVWRDTPSCVAAGTACAASFGIARFHCWAGSPLNLAENRCAHG